MIIFGKRIYAKHGAVFLFSFTKTYMQKPINLYRWNLYINENIIDEFVTQ